MTDKETLKELCKGCEYALSLSKQRCPFRSISNDYCDEYNDLLKDLEVLEILKPHLKLQNIGTTPKYEIVLVMDENMVGFDKIKEWLDNDK